VFVQHAQQSQLDAGDGDEALLMRGGEDGAHRAMGAPPSLQEQHVIQVFEGMQCSPHSVAAEHAGCRGASARHCIHATGEGATEQNAAQLLLGATARHTSSKFEAIVAAEEAAS
jgi:hypothetical protein